MSTILGVLGTALIVLGCAGATPTPAPSEVATTATSPGPSGGIGGTVTYQLDGAPATTEVSLVADGEGVSGTAVTTFSAGTHTVQLGCASRDGDTWALGGTVEKTTVPGEAPGTWSAVFVKDGTPQQIGIWLAEDASAAEDCEAWLASTDFATIGAENFSAIESGTLVPPG